MFATILVPNFYLQGALRHQSILETTPVGLIDERDKKPVIIQLNPAAEAAGITIGMTPSQGLARSLSLVVKVRSPAQEKSIETILLHYGFTLSPYIEATAPGICTVQFTDNRDLVTKVGHVINQLAACDIPARAGIAETPDTSFLLAHLAEPVLEIQNQKEFLASLSIDVLAIPLQS
jgi:protein ImuB